MKRTKSLIPRFVSGLGYWLSFMAFMLFFSNQTNAQTNNPLPTFKPRQEVILIVKQEIALIEPQVVAYGQTPPMSDPSFIRLANLYKAYLLIDDMLTNPDVTVSSAVGTAYTVINTPDPNSSAAIASIGGYYSKQWPSDYVDLVNKLKL
ncbi:MAG: hypothetical protein IPI90_05720 [Saprospiraceae bacterium]|nr:hypothetical protein [Candidatus Vicinibacter affinis]